MFPSKLNPGSGSNGMMGLAEIPVSPHFVLRVRGAAHTHYLRLRVYTDYSRGRWTTRNATRVRSNTLAPPKIRTPHHAEEDLITVTSTAPITGNLFTSLYTLRVRGVRTTAIPEYDLFETNSSVSSYSFLSLTYTFDWPYLLNLTAGNQTEYLSAPDDARLLELAMEVTRGASSDYEKAVMIERYLSLHYRHVENVRVPSNVDRLKWFLFRSKEGSSYDFATAFVILARLNGLPARLVEGVYIDAIPQTQVVTEKNLAFWAEVYFKSAGWLIFDPLHPGQNVYTPFELSVLPSGMSLSPGSFGRVTVKFERVESGENASVSVEIPTLGRVALLHGPGIYNLSVGPFTDPGYYPVVTTAVAEEGIPVSAVRVTPVLIPGSTEVTVNQPSVLLLMGQPAVLRIGVKGVRRLRIETSSPLLEGWSLKRAPGNETTIDLRLRPHPDYPPGNYIMEVDVVGGSWRYPLYVPVFVRDLASVAGEVPPVITAGDSMTINGTVRGATTGKDIQAGHVAVFLTDGGKSVLVGYGNVSNGKFSVPVKIPASLPPGEGRMRLYYTAPPGYPYLTSETESSVRVRGRAEFSMPGLVLARPGNVTVRGTLHDGGGRPIASAGVAYYLDGRPLGSTSTDENGRFLVTLGIEGLGQHTLTVEYPGSANYSRASRSVDIATIEIQVPATVTAKLGRPVVVRGEVRGIENATLLAYVFPQGTYTVRVVDGKFSLTVDPFKAVGDDFVEFRYGSTQLKRMTIRVVSPVRIELKAARRAGGQNVSMEFLAVDSLNNPIGGLPLNVSVDGFVAHTMTNESGVATLTLHLPPNETRPTVRVTFSGSAYYLPASAVFHVTIPRGRELPWTYIGLALAGIAVVGYSIRRRGREDEKTAPCVPEITFKDGVPVFREDESVEIDVSTRGDCEPELYIDGEPIGTGRKFKLRLPAGIHTVEVRCGEVVGRTSVLVVPDYSAAVVEYYERCLLPRAKELGIRTGGLTPREIAEALKALEYPERPVETITKVFERARYSPREIPREEFINFYRSILQVTGGDCIA